MMAYAIDLSPRQTTRTLEQAVRHRAEVFLVPRIRRDEEPIACRLEHIVDPTQESSSRACLVVVPVAVGCPAGGESDGEGSGAPAASAGCDAYEDLVGVYCDATLHLGDNRYLFCSDVVTVSPRREDSGKVQIGLARPEIIQVTQRRRFWRFRPRHSARVELSWTEGDHPPQRATGWLCNVSGAGLACRVEAQVADQLGIGGQVETEFALAPGDPHRFALDAILCSKTPAGTQGTMILGLQFSTGPGHASSAEAAEALRRHVLMRHAPSVDTSKGADG